MLKARTLALLLVSFWCVSPAQSQGMMEGTFVRGLGAGMGAGTAASMGHGKVVRRTAESMIQAQQAMLAQTKAIEQYVATGVQLAAKKQWQNAEQYFQEALKVIAKRDGPGSPKSVPVLAQLAKVSKNQHKLDDAIGYQKTVVAFANAGKAQNPTAAVQAQVDLSNLYMDKGDLANAEGVLKQSADIVRTNKSIPPKTYSTTLRVYGEVLRKLNKEAEAETIDKELAAQVEPATTASAGAPAGAAQTADTSVAPQVVPADATASSTSSNTNTTASAAATAGATSAPSTVIAPNATAAASVTPTASGTPTASDPSSSDAALDLKAPATATQPEPNPAATAPAAPTASAAPTPSTTSSSAASADAGASQNPPPSGGLLPPPTAEWPVMNSDGKIGAEPTAPAADSPPAAPAPAPPAAPAASQSAGETSAVPATSQPAEASSAAAPVSTPAQSDTK